MDFDLDGDFDAGDAVVLGLLVGSNDDASPASRGGRRSDPLPLWVKVAVWALVALTAVAFLAYLAGWFS